MVCWQGCLPFLPWCIVKETAWVQHSSSQQRAYSCGRSQHWVIDWSACLLQQTPTSSPRCCLTKSGFVNTTGLKPMWEWSISVTGRSLTELGICLIIRLTGKAAAEALIWGSTYSEPVFFSFWIQITVNPMSVLSAIVTKHPWCHGLFWRSSFLDLLCRSSTNSAKLTLHRLQIHFNTH